METTEKAAPLPSAAPATFKYSTPIPKSVTTPDRVETRALGTLRFFDGFPDEATVQKVYDNLDFQRGVEAFLDAMPAANLYAVRGGLRTFGPDNQTVLVTESLMDARTLFGTANTETVYTYAWLDTKDGPLVIEVPPNVLGLINDFWGRFVTDLGIAGPDRGKGGKFLLLPPDHPGGTLPEGHHVVRSRTYGNVFGFRGFLVDGDPRPAVESARKLRIYPLARAGSPPTMNFVNVSGESYNTMNASDASIFEQMAQVVEEEPLEACDPEIRGLLASIGIQKGKPFAPDARMRSILADAAAVGNATARALAFSTRSPDAYWYPNSTWKMVWTGGDYQFSPGGVLDLDARSLLFFIGFGVSPAMTVKMVGAGSQYAVTERDSTGQYLDGAKAYRLHLPPNIPAKNFWSIVVYDPQTRSMLQTDQQFPSTGSQQKGLVVNPDASVDVTFGPRPPAGEEANWVQTVPGKGFYVTLRLYGPLEPWFDKSWRPGEIEPIEPSVLH